MNSKYYKIFFYTYTSLLFLLSLLPLNSEGSAMNHTFVVSVRLDYLVHFAVFIPWVFLAQMSNNLSFRYYPTKTFKWLVIGLIFAAATEIVQYLVPYRSYNINDLVSNFIGILLGAAFFLSGLIPVPRFLKAKM